MPELEAVLAQGGRTETVASGKLHAGARVVFGGLVDRRGRRRASGAAPRLRPRRRRAPACAAAAIGAGAGRADPAGLRRDARAGRRPHHRNGADERQDRPSPAEPRALDEAEIRALEDPSFQGMRTAGVVGCGISRAGWNPSRSRTSAATNCTAARSNLPVRAMKGANWTGEEMNWRHAPGSTGDALSRRQRPRRRLGDRFR